MDCIKVLAEGQGSTQIHGCVLQRAHPVQEHFCLCVFDSENSHFLRHKPQGVHLCYN